MRSSSRILPEAGVTTLNSKGIIENQGEKDIAGGNLLEILEDVLPEEVGGKKESWKK